jgi:hypothetical protein
MSTTVIRKYGNIRYVKDDNALRKLVYTDRLLIQLLVNDYFKYMGRFRSDIVSDYSKLNEDLSNTDVDALVEEYATKADETTSKFFEKLAVAIRVTQVSLLMDYNASLSALTYFEAKYQARDRNALNSGITPLELNYRFTREILKAISCILYENGFEELPINLGDLANIINSIQKLGDKTLTFPSNNKKTGYETEILLQSILIPTYLDRIKDYIIIKGDDRNAN